MYQSSFTISLPRASKDIFLFDNPLLPEHEVRFGVCRIEYVASENSIWKLYLNPTVTSNGTAQTITNIGDTISPEAIIYKAPTISADGIHLRSFVVNKGFNYFTLTIPVRFLEAGNKILLKRTSTEKGSPATITLDWTEDL